MNQENQNSNTTKGNAIRKRLFCHSDYILFLHYFLMIIFGFLSEIIFCLSWLWQQKFFF